MTVRDGLRAGGPVEMEADERKLEDGAEEAKESFNQSNQERVERWGTYKARPFGRWFRTNKFDIGRRSFHGDELGQLRGAN